VITALRRLRQEDYEFQANLDHTVRLYPKKKLKKELGFDFQEKNVLGGCWFRIALKLDSVWRKLFFLILVLFLRFIWAVLFV
jgi:hypothetical protein